MELAWSIDSEGERGEDVRAFAAGGPSLRLGSLAPVNASNTEFGVSGAAAGKPAARKEPDSISDPQARAPARLRNLRVGFLESEGE